MVRAIGSKDEDKSVLESAGDFILRGLPSAVVSAGVGFGNTAIALTNSFGANIQQIDEQKVISSTFGYETGEYYADNKTGVDAVGMVLGSLIPGLAAIKGVRAGQAALISRNLSTGITRALLPMDKAADMAKAIKAGGVSKLDAMTMLETNKLNLIASGFHQQALEAAAFEGAVLLTMNQNSSLSAEDVGYFEGIGQNMGHAAFGLVAGTAFGGTFEAFSNWGKAKGLISNFMKETAGDWKVNSTGVLGGFVAGDAVLPELASYYDAKKFILSAADMTDPTQASTIAGRLADVKLKKQRASDLVNRRLLEMTPSVDMAQTIFTKLDAMDNIEDAAKFLSGVKEFKPTYARNLLIEPAASDIIHTDRDSIRRMLGKVYASMGKEIPKEVQRSIATAQGFAYNGTEIAGLSGVRGVAFTDEMLDWEDLAIWRHETGHSLANRIADRFSDAKTNRIKNTKIGRALAAEMEKLSRQVRPGDWALVDDYEGVFAYPESLERFSPHEIAQMQQHINYMRKGRELVADSYAILSDAKSIEAMGLTIDEAKEAFPTLYGLFKNNTILAKEFENGKQLLSIRDMKLYDTSMTTTAADLSADGVSLIGKTVKWGKDNTEVLDFDYSKEFLNISWDKASALHAVAATRPDIVEGVSVDWLNIPALTSLKAKGIGNFTITKDGVDITRIDNGVDTMLNMHLLRAKAEVSDQLLKRSAKARAMYQAASKATDAGANTSFESVYSMSEIARIVDIDPASMTRITGLTHLIKTNSSYDEILDFAETHLDDMYWSANPQVDATKAQFAHVIADPRAVQDGAKLSGMADAMMREKHQRIFNDSVVAGFFKEMNGNLPTAAHMQASHFADQVTGVDQTSTLVSSGNALPGSGIVEPQYIGRVLDRTESIRHEQPVQLFKGDIIKLAQESDAVYEGNVLDSILRQRTVGDEFEFVPANLEEFAENLGSAAQQISDEIFDIVASSELASKLFDTPNQIWAGEPRKRLAKLLTSEMDEVDLLDELDILASELTPNLHQIKSETLANFWRKMVDYNGREYVYHKNMLNIATGGKGNLNPRALYPGTPDTARYPFVALVVAEKKGVMGVRSVGMVTGHSRDSLEKNMTTVRQGFGDEVEIVTKDQIKRFKELAQEYEAERLFGDTYMDTSMKRKGVAWEVAPQPTPELFNQYLTSAQRQQSSLARGMVELKYSEELGALKTYSQYIEDLNSTFTKKPFKRNIYRDVENMMLNKRPDDQQSIWNQINTITEGAISKAYYTVSGAARQAMQTGDWEKMNEVLDRYGMREIYSPANPVLLNKIEAPQPVLNKLVSKLNFALGTSMLRMDSAHALTNLISMPVMLTSELGNLRRSISKDTWQVLKDGTSVLVPGTNVRMPTNTHMIMQAIKNYFKNPELITEYKKRGVINSLLEDIAAAQKSFADLPGITDPNKASEILEKFINVVSTPTDWSEQFVKFVAANVADQFTTAAKLSPRLKSAAINNFVTRVHGNYLASQRPTLFQGWMGQTVGLFQTYQFNLLQSLFQNVTAGNKAAVVNMIAAQAGIFGAQSVPGFQLLNKYIGERSQENNDFYSVSGKMLGDDLANWLMYGTASSATVPLIGNGLDLYSRGDLTPRTPILIPTSLTEVPLVSVTANFIGAVTNAVGKLENGAPLVTTMLDALGHNGFNRPLQGLGQLLVGERTTNQGQLLATYQNWDMWNWATKLSGSKPLDEAIAVSSYYRTAAYSSFRQQKLNNLGEAFRQELRDTGDYDQDTYNSFMEKYTEAGGRIEYFSRWVGNNVEGASTSVINRLRQNNNSPEGRYLQEVMGGELEDYTKDFQ